MSIYDLYSHQQKESICKEVAIFQWFGRPQWVFSQGFIILEMTSAAVSKMLQNLPLNTGPWIRSNHWSSDK